MIRHWKEVGEANAAIFEVHQMMLEDEDYLDGIKGMIRDEQLNAEYAVSVTGQNFSEILNHVRMEEAKRLLENPSLRIGDIAETVGFLDMAHFSRVFRSR